MRWVLVAALVLLVCAAAAYGAWIENVASMTYTNPYSGERVTVYSNTVRAEVLEPHTIDIVATAEPIQ